jgi:hypothetical protein
MILEKEEEDEYYDFSDDIFACMTVTIGGIWISNWIYWPLTDRNYK